MVRLAETGEIGKESLLAYVHPCDTDALVGEEFSSAGLVLAVNLRLTQVGVRGTRVVVPVLEARETNILGALDLQGTLGPQVYVEEFRHSLRTDSGGAMGALLDRPLRREQPALLHDLLCDLRDLLLVVGLRSR